MQNQYKQANRYKGTYLHGRMEADYKHDIFSFERKQKFEEGVHEIKVNKKDCTFFLWKSREPKEKRMYDWRGYLVYSKDSEARQEALNAYVNKKELL